MRTTKVYKTKIGTKFAILKAKLKNFFNGSHYVVETFSTKYNTDTKEYTLEHYTLTREEDRQIKDAIAAEQARIMQMVVDEAPTMQLQKQKQKNGLRTLNGIDRSN